MPTLENAALSVVKNHRVAVFIVAYNAEQHIEKVLRRIPEWIAPHLAEIFIIDDHSTDRTSEVAKNVDWPAGNCPIRVFRTPTNQGYGGNQRLGYLYAIERGFDIVVLLHGDGQYAPEALPAILAPYDEGAQVVYGSRFLSRFGSLKGGMPLYKFVGNRVLTAFENWMLRTSLSEFHSGYRSYRTAALKRIPFQLNSRGFDFDTDIIVQLVAAGIRIHEVEIPTYYGDEICRVNGIDYAFKCFKAVVRYRLMGFELYYDPKYDLRRAIESTAKYQYTIKASPYSIHTHVQNLRIGSGERLLDVGGGEFAQVTAVHAERGASITSIDLFGEGRADPSGNIRFHRVDLNQPWQPQFKADVYQRVFALDVLEHLNDPEKGLQEIFNVMQPDGRLYASTGNVAFVITRLMLFLGQFNYGRKGILDLTHRRLFTLRSFRRLLRQGGFEIESMHTFGPPIADVLGSDSAVGRFLDRLAHRLAQWMPGLFAFQMLFVCRRLDGAQDLIRQTFEASPELNTHQSRFDWKFAPASVEV